MTKKSTDFAQELRNVAARMESHGIARAMSLRERDRWYALVELVKVATRNVQVFEREVEHRLSVEAERRLPP